MARIAFFIFLVSLTAFCADKWGLTIIFNNDRHGGIAPGEATFLNPETPPPLAKYPAEANLIKFYREQAKARGEGFIYIEQGDIYQGAPVGSLSEGEAIVAVFNVMMPDAVAMGNHEFDNGFENFKKLIRDAKFDWIGANLIETSTGKLVEGLKPYIIRKYPLPNGENLTVGIIGITTTDTKRMSFPENTAQITVLDEVTAINAYAETLRTIYKADFVIVSAHSGLPFDAMQSYYNMVNPEGDYEGGGTGYVKSTDLVGIANKVKGVNVIFGGHIHVGYKRAWEDPETHILVFQNYAQGTGTGIVRFLFDPKTKVFLGYEPVAKDNLLVTLFSDEFPSDADMLKLVDSLSAESEKGLSEPVGEALGVLPRGDAATNRVGHIMCDAMIEVTGADVGTTNMGGVRAEIPAGTITRKDVFTVMPFDNKIIVVPLTGQQLVEVMEKMSGKYTGALIGGAEVKFNSKTGKIVGMKIAGEKVDSTKTYELATSDYVFYSYNIPQFDQIDKATVKFTGLVMRDAIERWIKKHTPVSPEVDHRWINVEE